MKRHLATLAIASLTLGSLALTSAGAYSAPSTAPLFKYVKTSDGYAYDSTKPVMLYPNSSEQVQIPASYEQQNRQLKSSWVATVANIGFGKVSGAADFQTRYTQVLDDFESWNMNTMLFQVSPQLDSFYPSVNRPWSEFLQGTQGKDPGFDPLAYMVEETHKRGMEYHAWLNPYRVTFSKKDATSIVKALKLTAPEIRALSVPEYISALNKGGLLADNNYAVLHPDEVLIFDEKLFLNPGMPGPQQHVRDTVNELITNYDIDAIHFDDYFYPYKVGTQVFGDLKEDRSTFETYGLASNAYPDTQAGIESWRRDNITSLVTGVKDTIDEHNASAHTAVQLGISPFGIWEHKTRDPRGSNTPTSSSNSYSGSIFADTRGWIKNELVDYMTPQIYWAFDTGFAPYGELARWWNDAAEGTDVQIYIGHAQYKHLQNGGSDPAWMNPEEVANQIRFNQTLPNVKGSMLYGYPELLPSSSITVPADKAAQYAVRDQANDILKGTYFAQPSLTPAKPQLTSAPLAASPVDAVYNADTQQLTWKADASAPAREFAIYAGEGSAADIIAAPGTLVDTVWAGSTTSFTFDATAYNNKPQAFDAGSTSTSWVVTALNAAAVESSPALATAPQVDPEKPVTPVTPTEPLTPNTNKSAADAAKLTASGDQRSGTLAATGTANDLWLLAVLTLVIAGTIMKISRRKFSLSERNLHK